MTELTAKDEAGRDPAKLTRGVGHLVVTLIDVVRQLLERQAGRRMEAGNLDAAQLEALGKGLMKLEQKVRELKRVFELDEDDELDLRLDTSEGTLVSTVDLLDTLMARGVTLSGDLTLSIAEVELLNVVLRVALGSPDSFHRAVDAARHGTPATLL